MRYSVDPSVYSALGCRCEELLAGSQTRARKSVRQEHLAACPAHTETSRRAQARWSWAAVSFLELGFFSAAPFPMSARSGWAQFEGRERTHSHAHVYVWRARRCARLVYRMAFTNEVAGSRVGLSCCDMQEAYFAA